MSEHTKTPWTVSRDNWIHGHLETEVIAAYKYLSHDDADFIVKAVNNHDKLVDALKHANEMLKLVSDYLNNNEGDECLDVVVRNQALLEELK